MAKKPVKNDKSATKIEKSTPKIEKSAMKVEKVAPVKTEKVVVVKVDKNAAKNNKNAIIEQLDTILEAELSGVVRYLHYSFMIFGPNRIPITKWFRDQANEGMMHAVEIGEKITAFGGHPSIKVQPVPERNKHNVIVLLKESLEFEKATIELYKTLLQSVGDDIALEEMVRDLIKEEVAHFEEVEKMCRTIKE